jgi:hypothetical protein
MRSRVTLSSALVAIATACDPVAGVTLRQSLTPSPKAECVRTALAASPLVRHTAPIEVERFRKGFSINFFLQDTVAVPGAPLPPWLELVEERRDTADLRLFIGYFGRRASDIGQPRVDSLLSVVTPIADAIRVACAPNPPVLVSCRVEGGFDRSRSCAPAPPASPSPRLTPEPERLNY